MRGVTSVDRLETGDILEDFEDDDVESLNPSEEETSEKGSPGLFLTCSSLTLFLLSLLLLVVLLASTRLLSRLEHAGEDNHVLAMAIDAELDLIRNTVTDIGLGGKLAYTAGQFEENWRALDGAVDRAARDVPAAAAVLRMIEAGKKDRDGLMRLLSAALNLAELGMLNEAGSLLSGRLYLETSQAVQGSLAAMVEAGKAGVRGAFSAGRDVIIVCTTVSLILVPGFFFFFLAVMRWRRTSAREFGEASKAIKEALGSLYPPLIQRQLREGARFVDLNHLDVEFSCLAVVDMVGFDSLHVTRNPSQVADVVSTFHEMVDLYCQRFGVFKASSGVTSCVVATGLDPEVKLSHEASVKAVLQLVAALRDASNDAFSSTSARLRFGIGSGSIHVGLFGKLRPSFEVFSPVVLRTRAIADAASAGEVMILSNTAALNGSSAAADGIVYAPLAVPIHGGNAFGLIDARKVIFSAFGDQNNNTVLNTSAQPSPTVLHTTSPKPPASNNSERSFHFLSPPAARPSLIPSDRTSPL